MRVHAYILLSGAAAAYAGNTANLLLPGFQGHDLLASAVASQGDATTYLVTCPTTVASSACGIPGSGMTAIAAPTSAQLVNVYDGKTASLSCNIASTTYASCSATEGTVTVTQTLGPKDLNWMDVTLTSSSTPTPTSTHTHHTHTSTSTSTVTPTSTPSSSSKSSTRVASSTRLVTSTPLSAPTGAALNQVTASGAGPSATASATPNANGAASLAGNVWVVGGAAMALFYALA
ncbi:hypothetical protein N7468_005593 [Penicillium chermesinum]|uniref:GPI anchored protein n=1 Tax=Penicillium chermesinum TaxID=63820 RepID=A0A9W9NZK9_9EURO|nr:uncharacterized protein N7468_005593 [Penicillium chermesinum]KAJ5232637.1 hypothetical protein N7468_005593 [Penicillium chermesinum]